MQHCELLWEFGVGFRISCRSGELWLFATASPATLFYPLLGFNAGIGWAYRCACRTIMETDAFRALFRHYIVEILRESRLCFAFQLIVFATGIDRLVRAFGLASSAIDTFLDDL
jgi:hypothetical protein